MEIQHPFRPERGEAPLGQYRLYFLDSVDSDRLISDSLEFEAGSDGAALQVAESMRAARPIELWRGSRKLRVWNPGPDAADEPHSVR